MQLVACEHCGKALADQVTICRACGYSRSSKWAQAARARLYRRARFIASALQTMSILIVIGFIGTVAITVVLLIAGHADRFEMDVTGTVLSLITAAVLGGLAVFLELHVEQTARQCRPDVELEGDSPEPRAEFGSSF